MEAKEPINLCENSSLEISQKKRQIRKEVLQLREQLPEGVRKMASYKLADRIIGHQWFYRSENILIFVGFGSEIDTSEIIGEAFRTGKKVYVPRVEGDVMHFYRIHSMEELAPGYRGIPEPNGHSEKYVYLPKEAERTLLIMPGVAFDPYRNRIGYGKGFYDKYLSDKESLQLRTIAIGFQCQMVEEIPCEDRDIKPYQVIVV